MEPPAPHPSTRSGARPGVPRAWAWCLPLSHTSTRGTSVTDHLPTFLARFDDDPSVPADLALRPPPASVPGAFVARRSVSAAGVAVADPGATFRAGERITLESFPVPFTADFTAAVDPTLSVDTSDFSDNSTGGLLDLASATSGWAPSPATCATGGARAGRRRRRRGRDRHPAHQPRRRCGPAPRPGAGPNTDSGDPQWPRA